MSNTLSEAELSKLVQYLEFKSVANTKGNNQACTWLADWLGTFCNKVEIIGNKNNLIVASINGINQKTICLYGHYDVQPANKSEGWKSDPFNPTVTPQEIIGRGTTDNKGQNFAFLLSLERIIRNGDQPLHNVVIILEGEEEIGSVHLKNYLSLSKSCIGSADAYLLADGTSDHESEPAIYTSTLGVVFGQILIDNNLGDVHSGIFQKEIAQPNEILAAILTDLYQKSEKIIPKLSKKDNWSFSVNYLSSGSSPKKSVVPGKTKAVISYRFSEIISCQEIIDGIRGYLAKIAVKHSMRITLKPKVVAEPTVSSKTNLAYKICSNTLNSLGQKYHEGKLRGTLPAASIIGKLYGIDPIIISFGSKNSHTHGPNESIRIATLEKSISFFTLLLKSKEN